MIYSDSIYRWGKYHSREETELLLTSGEVIYFAAEKTTTSDSMTRVIIDCGYLYFEIEHERRSFEAKARWARKRERGTCDERKGGETTCGQEK